MGVEGFIQFVEDLAEQALLEAGVPAEKVPCAPSPPTRPASPPPSRSRPTPTAPTQESKERSGQHQGDLPALWPPDLGQGALQRPIPALRQGGSRPLHQVGSWRSCRRASVDVDDLRPPPRRRRARSPRRRSDQSVLVPVRWTRGGSTTRANTSWRVRQASCPSRTHSWAAAARPCQAISRDGWDASLSRWRFSFLLAALSEADHNDPTILADW
jgi:hypothetical protein